MHGDCGKDRGQSLPCKRSITKHVDLLLLMRHDASQFPRNVCVAKLTVFPHAFDVTALITTHGPIEIDSTHWLSLMRLIQVLLMEWMESDKLKEKLLTMGCVYHLMKVLQRMTTTMHLTSDKVSGSHTCV